jgi:hypothetical protein
MRTNSARWDTGMTESPTNRGFVIANRIGEHAVSTARRGDSAETLLYYQAQLEAELSEVRRRLVELTRSGA